MLPPSRLRLVVALCASGLFSSSFAQAPAAPKIPPSAPSFQSPIASTLLPAPSWSSLSPEERSILAPIKDQFDGMEPHRRRKWAAVAKNWGQYGDREKANIRQKMVEWASLSPAERERIRKLGAAYSEAAASPKINDKWLLWSKMSPAEKKALIDKLNAANESK